MQVVSIQYLIQVDQNGWPPLFDLDWVEAKIFGLEVFYSFKSGGLDKPAAGGVSPAVVRTHEPMKARWVY